MLLLINNLISRSLKDHFPREVVYKLCLVKYRRLLKYIVPCLNYYRKLLNVLKLCTCSLIYFMKCSGCILGCTSNWVPLNILCIEVKFKNFMLNNAFRVIFINLFPFKFPIEIRVSNAAIQGSSTLLKEQITVNFLHTFVHLFLLHLKNITPFNMYN